MNLFDIYERLEGIVKFYTNPKTSSNYSAFCELNDFQNLCITYIARGVLRVTTSFDDQMRIIKEGKYLSNKCIDGYYKHHDNDDTTIEDVFAYSISLYLETILCFCNVAADSVNKYLHFSKLGNLTKYLIDDLIAFGFDKNSLLQKSGYNDYENAL